MVWIIAVVVVVIVIDVLIWGRNDEDAIGIKHPLRLTHEVFLRVNVFDRFKTDRDVKAVAFRYRILVIEPDK